MSKKTLTKYDDVLDEETLRLLGDAPAPLDVSPERMQRLRDRIMQKIDDDIAQASQAFLTVRTDDGDWVEIAPKISKKVLYANSETGAESYLLKADPGAEAPPHSHEHDEHCVVLEGAFTFGEGIYLKAGDYHFAPRGSEHGIASTDIGVLVYIQTAPQATSTVS